MVKNYETVEAQKEMYQKQIDATEKVSSLMEQYIAAFQDGSMSYQDVLSKFDELILAAKDGFSSQEYLDAILNSTGIKIRYLHWKTFRTRCPVPIMILRSI